MEVILKRSSLFYKSFFALFLVVLTASCSSEKKEKPVKNGIDAEILNLQDSTLLFYSLTPPLDQIKGKEPEFYLEIETDSNGIFVKPLDLKEGYYYLEHDHVRSLYFIQKGKRLSLDFDAQKPSEKPDFSGKLKYESRYLYDRYLAHAQFTAKQSTYYTYSENEFVAEVTHVRGALDTSLVMYIANHPTGSPIFMEQESLTNLYFMAAYLEAYAVKRKSKDGQKIPLSEDYYQLLNQINVNDPRSINNPEFYQYIQNFVWARAGEPKNSNAVISQLAFVDSVFTVQEYKDYLRFQAAREVGKWENTPNRKLMLDTLSGLISDHEIKTYLIKNIQQDTASIPMVNQVILEDQ
ncbi:MAG: hypothetical protein ACPGD5_06325 [Salibacteraceae bacterium]